MYFVCCKILGVDPGSDLEEIKSAFRKSAKELHPDINDSEKAHQYFIVLQNAYQYLLDHPYDKNDIEFYRKTILERAKERSAQFSRSVNIGRIKRKVRTVIDFHPIKQIHTLRKITIVIDNHRDFIAFFITMGFN